MCIDSLNYLHFLNLIYLKWVKLFCQIRIKDIFKSFLTRNFKFSQLTSAYLRIMTLIISNAELHDK